MPMRILYVHATFVPPPTNLETDRFYLLSKRLRRRCSAACLVSYSGGSGGRFRTGILSGLYGRPIPVSLVLILALQGARQRLATFWFYLRKGLALCRERRYDCIVAYSHMTTGLCAGLLKLLTGGKLIIEIATSPNLVYLTERPHPTWKERLMHLYSDACLHLSMLMADRSHFLFPQQLSMYSDATEGQELRISRIRSRFDDRETSGRII